MRVLNSLDKFLLFVALPTVVIASLAEAIVLARVRSYDWRASAVSLFDLFARVAVQLFLPLSIATPLIGFAYQHRIGQVALDHWTALARALSSARSSATTGTTAPRTGCAGSGATTRSTIRRTS